MEAGKKMNAKKEAKKKTRKVIRNQRLTKKHLQENAGDNDKGGTSVPHKGTYAQLPP